MNVDHRICLDDVKSLHFYTHDAAQLQPTLIFDKGNGWLAISEELIANPVYVDLSTAASSNGNKDELFSCTAP